MATWRDMLISEKIPLNGELQFSMQNGSVSRVLREGRQVEISKKSRRLVSELIKDYRDAKYMGVDFSDSLHPFPLTIHFHDGSPNAKRTKQIDFKRERDFLDYDMMQRDYQSRSI